MGKANRLVTVSEHIRPTGLESSGVSLARMVVRTPVLGVDGNSMLKLLSPIMRNNKGVVTPHFAHTGVILKFQRRKAGVVPQADWLADLERRISKLEQLLG